MQEDIEEQHRQFVERWGCEPFTDAQKTTIHAWMNDARSEGVAEAVQSIIHHAAALYFKACPASDGEAANLCDEIYRALVAAEEAQADGDEA